MSVHYRIIDQYLAIVGHTYPHKEGIKALGARFDRNEKIWKLDNNEQNLRELENFCQQLGGGCLNQDSAAKVTRPTNNVTQSPIDATSSFPESDSFSVSQLVSKAQLALSSAFPGAIWVVGEIQNLSQRGSGTFFALAEEKSKKSHSNATININSTLWNNTLIHIHKKHSKGHVEELLADGMKVRLLCQVSLYKDRGQLSLNVLDIDPSFTKGALALAREALLKELRQKGLDRVNKALTLTKFPFKIGLISADNSRAKSDFIDQLQSYGFCGQVVFFDARMQGDQVTVDVPLGVKALSDNQCDIIVITRGGGSAADLRWFDSKEVALAIANSQVPILAAIGHHEDVCIAEEISFRREKTPTAAADFILTTFSNTKQYIEQLASNIINLIDQNIDQQRANGLRLRNRLQSTAIQSLTQRQTSLQQASHNIAVKASSRIVGDLSLLERKNSQLKQVIQRFIDERERHQLLLEKKLITVDPSPWLKKGWTQIYRQKKLIKSLHEIEVNDHVNARMLDGTMQLKVTNKEVR